MSGRLPKEKQSILAGTDPTGSWPFAHAEHRPMVLLNSTNVIDDQVLRFFLTADDTSSR